MGLLSMWLISFHILTKPITEIANQRLLIAQMRNITSQAVIQALEKVFRVTGYPEVLRSDNGRQFVSSETEAYLASKGVRHETSSPELTDMQRQPLKVRRS